MHPFIIKAIAAEQARELRETAKRSRDARLASGRRQRQHDAARAAATVRPHPLRRRVLAERLGSV